MGQVSPFFWFLLVVVFLVVLAGWATVEAGEECREKGGVWNAKASLCLKPDSVIR